MEAVAEAVIQARFIRSRLSSDEVWSFFVGSAHDPLYPLPANQQLVQIMPSLAAASGYKRQATTVQLVD